jgi:hypothetical protein
MYLVYTLHNSGSDCPPTKCKQYDKAVDLVHQHFITYNCELINGRPFDSGNESDDDPESGFSVFSDVEIYNGKVARFTHCNGDGPMGWIEKV